MQLTCPDCGLTFETQASTNTRSRRWRKVVNVGARRTRPPTVAATSDDTPDTAWGPLVGAALAVGGAAGLWHGG